MIQYLTFKQSPETIMKKQSFILHGEMDEYYYTLPLAPILEKRT